MGLVIERVGVVPADSTAGSIDRMVAAGRICLDGTGDQAVHALINIGVYRDSNIVEPAIAALVQKRLALGLRYSAGCLPVLSFDLLNGACGFLSAVETAMALLAGTGGRCLVVAGDGHPAGPAAPGFPYASVGAAALLEVRAVAAGFGRVRSVSGDGAPVLHGFVDLAAMGTEGRETLHFGPAIENQGDLVKMAAVLGRECLEDEGAVPERVALVVSQPFPGFAQRVADELGISEVLAAPAGTGLDPHTASPIVAYDLAAASAAPGTDLLFLAAGAGPVAAASLYRRERA